MSFLKEKYKEYEIVGDIEKIDETAIDNKERKRRREFYFRNGYKSTEYFMFYRDIDYEMIYSGNNFNLDLFKELIKNINSPNFKPYFHD